MRPGYRQRRPAERGFTLAETVVAIFVISVAVVGLVGAFAAAERSAGIAVTQTQAEVHMRQVVDALRQPQAYVPCSPTAGYTLPSGVTIQQGVMVPPATSGGTANAYWDCTTSTALNFTPCPPSHNCDYGVQRLSLLVTYSTGSLTRVMYKAAH